MNADFDAPDAETLTAAMTSCLSSVKTASITVAARDSEYDGYNIKEGDYLALDDGNLFGADPSLDELLNRIAHAAAQLSAAFISLYYGEDIDANAAKEAGKVFEAACPDAEVAVLSGGQPVYRYIISIE